MIDWETARRNMVESQIRPNGVTDRRLIAALLEVPRERFAAAGARPLAYCDEDIAVTEGDPDTPPRHLIAPMVFARMAQLADISERDLVLDIGCATGYSSAVIARLAGSVVALEELPELADRAQSLFAEIGVDNVAVVQGPLHDGYPSQAPYDAIIIEGAVDEVPEALFGQLGNGGRLVAVIRGAAIGRAHLFVRDGEHVGGRPAFDAAIPALPGFARERGFVFHAG